MSIGRYIWASDIRKNPNGIVSYFEKTSSSLGEIEKFHIDIACFDFRTKKEYAIYIRPDRKNKSGRFGLSTGDNMCLKLGDDGASAPKIANQLYDIISKKYECVGESRTVDATDTRRYYANMKSTPITFPM